MLEGESNTSDSSPCLVKSCKEENMNALMDTDFLCLNVKSSCEKGLACHVCIHFKPVQQGAVKTTKKPHSTLSCLSIIWVMWELYIGAI